MNLLGTLENGLFALGQVLRLPVICLLWACVLSVLFMSGSCLMVFLSRRRARQGFNIKRWLAGGPVLASTDERRSLLPSELRRFLGRVEAICSADALVDGSLDHLVLESEERERKALQGSRILVKVAPSLGLIGTLIPMGVSLAAMSTGNLDAMAGQMVVAFTTTITGLACGTAAYVILVIRQGWVTENVREQRYLAERIANELERSRPQQSAGSSR